MPVHDFLLVTTNRLQGAPSGHRRSGPARFESGYNTTKGHPLLIGSCAGYLGQRILMELWYFAIWSLRNCYYRYRLKIGHVLGKNVRN